MAFVLKRNPTFRRGVKFAVPGDEGAETHAIGVTFRLTTKDNYNKLSKLLMSAEKPGADVESVDKEMFDLIADHVHNWDGVNDEQGAPIGYSRPVFMQALETYPGFAIAVSTVFMESAIEVIAKNDETLAKNGPKAAAENSASLPTTSKVSSSLTPPFPMAEAGTLSQAMASSSIPA